MVQVRVSKEMEIDWIVWLGDRVVGRFAILGEALDYASILECSPRARAAAQAA